MAYVYFLVPGMSLEMLDWFDKSREVDVDYGKIIDNKKKAELRNWLEDHCAGDVLVRTEKVTHAGGTNKSYPIYIRILFELEEDVTLFKLTWE